MSQPFISQVLKEPLTPKELNKHWRELGRCEFGAEYCRSGGLMENCEVLALLQIRALHAINNRWTTIGQSRDWQTKRNQLSPERQRWCEVSLCVQMAELAPDMRTSYKHEWQVGHQSPRGVKPSHQTDLIDDWLRGIVKNYERWIENEERIGLSIMLHGEVKVYPSEIVNAAKLLAKVKETKERERDDVSKALLTSIEEARAKFGQFGIGTRSTKDNAKWILLLADAWGLEPTLISLATRAIKRNTGGQQ